jgi:hypothetical protein
VNQSFLLRRRMRDNAKRQRALRLAENWEKRKK